MNSSSTAAAQPTIPTTAPSILEAPKSATSTAAAQPPIAPVAPSVFGAPKSATTWQAKSATSTAAAQPPIAPFAPSIFGAPKSATTWQAKSATSTAAAQPPIAPFAPSIFGAPKSATTWQVAVSTTYDREYWFRDGDEPTWHNPTQLKGAIYRLEKVKIADSASLLRAYDDLKVFMSDGFDTIVDWLFSQNAMTNDLSSKLLLKLCAPAAYHVRLRQRCRSAVQVELESKKEDYPFLRLFGYLSIFDQDQQDTLKKLMAPFLSARIEYLPLSFAFKRLKAFSTAGLRGADEMKSLVTILLQKSGLSKKSREILVEVGCLLSSRADPPQTIKVLESSTSVDKDLKWLFAAESPRLPSGSSHTVVVLLGPPIVGKSFMGRYFQSQGCTFLDIGCQLRNLRLLQNSQLTLTEATRQNRRVIAIDLLDKALRIYMQSEATHPMVVTFVKSVEDAYILLDRVVKAAERAAVQCRVQALYLWDSDYLNLYGIVTERKRDMKWEANKVGIFEVFASQNSLFEFKSETESSSYVKWRYHRKFPQFSVYPLVTSMDKRSNIVAHVKQLLGLETIEFMQPSSFLQSEQQCRWISFPGSYQVSYKVKGTRYWLIVLQQGSSCWLLNRMGSIYEVGKVDFSMSNPSDNSFGVLDDSVFDGMLLTECSGAVHQFIVFDVLCFNGLRSWPLSLHGRLAKLSPLSPFTAAVSPYTAAGNTTIFVQRNISQPITADNVCALLQSKVKKAVVGAVDGLIFTPTTAYTFGTSVMAFKWQDLQDFKVDITSEKNYTSQNISQPNSKKRQPGNTLDVTSAETAKSKSLKIVGRQYCTGYVYQCAWRLHCWTIERLCFDKNRTTSDYICKAFLNIKTAVELGSPLWDVQMLVSALKSHELLLHVHSGIGPGFHVSFCIVVVAKLL